MLTIILKGTNGCNLACSYCSLGKKINTEIPDRERLLSIMRYACHTALFRNEKELYFILHGGEPTLIDADIYSYVFEEIKKEFSNLNILFAMQTNCLNVDKKLVSFIKKYDINIGVSIDGSKNIHDAERRCPSGEPTYERVKKNIHMLIDNKINVSCLMVLTSNALKEGYDYLQFFAENNLHLKINPLLNYGEASENSELSLNKGDYSKYLIALYRYIIENDISVNVSPLDKILQAIIYDISIKECTFRADCNKNFLCIDYKGNIYPCGKFADMNQFLIGNIKENNYDILNTDTIKHLLKRRAESIPQKCKDCKFFHLCNAGCSAQAVIDGSFNVEPRLCYDYKRLFEFFYKDGLILLKEELLRQKMELIDYGL